MQKNNVIASEGFNPNMHCNGQKKRGEIFNDSMEPNFGFRIDCLLLLYTIVSLFSSSLNLVAFSSGGLLEIKLKRK